MWSISGWREAILSGRLAHMILPDGAIELIINLGRSAEAVRPDDPARYTAFSRSWISGERTEPIVIDETGYVHLVGVRLRQAAHWALSRIPLQEFNDQVSGAGSHPRPEMRALARPVGEAAD